MKQDLTLDQATQLRNKYQHLVGEKLHPGKEDSLSISLVEVVPFDDIACYIFMMELKACGDIEVAMTTYDGSMYDVAVIAKTISDKVNLSYTPIAGYLIQVAEQTK